MLIQGRMVFAAVLQALAAAAALLSSASAAADPVDRWAAEIAEASSRFSIPGEWIRRVMRIESGGRTLLAGKPIVSRAGAIGLMQLMPGTWRDMRALLGLGRDPQAPADNILAGAAYLRLMYDRFGYPGLFAAYNAGPARYAAFSSVGRELPAETRAYVATVAQGKPRFSDAPPHAVPVIFAIAPGGKHSTAAALRSEASAGLFMPLGSAGDR